MSLQLSEHFKDVCNVLSFSIFSCFRSFVSATLISEKMAFEKSLVITDASLSSPVVVLSMLEENWSEVTKFLIVNTISVKFSNLDGRSALGSELS